MRIELKDGRGFDPGLIDGSGQCFRWKKLGEADYRIISGNQSLRITADNGTGAGNDRRSFLLWTAASQNGTVIGETISTLIPTTPPSAA